jgi:manganese efflux pump family protein
VAQALLTAGLLLPLALDTFALAAALGVAGLEERHRVRVALIFTIFEAGMPIVGLLAGRAVSGLVGDWAGYAGIVVLFVAGVMLLRSGNDAAPDRRLRLLAHARGLAIVDLGIGISVDELSVGFSAGLLALPIALMVVWIAVQAFLAAQVGLRIGARISEHLKELSEQAAGVALIVVAIVLVAVRLFGV